MSDSDSWRTPDALFNELNNEFHFDIDLCATKENSKCNVYCKDYLSTLQVVSVNDGYGWELVGTLKEFIKDGDVKTAFMNPPYSNPKPFIEKAWEDSKQCKIVCLVKCDPSTKWWAVFWDHNRGPKNGCEVRFFPKRVQFDPPAGFEGKASGPSFPSALVIMDRRNIS